MSCRFVAFTVLALAGAILIIPQPATSAGFRGMAGGVRAPFVAPRIRTGFLHASPRIAPRAFQAHGLRAGLPPRAVIPPSAHGFATTTPLHPFGRLVRRHHDIYRSGWVYPGTFGDDGYGYLGTPYDPAEAIPVYGPAPASDPADPPPSRAYAPGQPRVTSATDDDNRDACRSEKVRVPGSDGEREITVVRC